MGTRSAVACTVDLRQLRYFLTVAEERRFSAAARRLNMSTTMVSNHVQALEDRLGVRLLNRTTRKVSLTEIGKAYYDRATQILSELEQADDIASELHLNHLRIFGTLAHIPMPVLVFTPPVQECSSFRDSLHAHATRRS